jgi:hypothetical protein
MKKYGFIELPIIAYNPKHEEIFNKRPDECELIEIVRKVKVARIESYHEGIPVSDFRDDNKIWTDVFMEIGDSYIVNMPLAEFEKLLINHLENL